MRWEVGVCALVWIVLLIWAGLGTLRNGHRWMFFLGLFLPVLWIIGVFSKAADAQA